MILGLDSIIVGPLQTNCYIIVLISTNTGIIIDPGDEPEKILKVIEEKKDLKVKYIFHTHSHIDHINGTGIIKGKTSAKTYLHYDDISLYKNVKTQGEQFGIKVNNQPLIDEFYKDGDKIVIDGITFEVIHTPGHTPGSVCLKVFDILFTGDTLFNMGIGRTDLWGGSYTDLMTSIKEKLFTLKDETNVFPGHGLETTIGYEKRNNPFFEKNI